MSRILVVAPNWIGDALMAQPLFTRLREKLSGIRLEVLAPQWVAPVLRRMPEVDEIIPAPFRHGASQLHERWRLGRALRARHYDQAIVLPNSWKSALVPYLADIPLRSGYVGERRYGLLNLLYRHNAAAPEAMVEHYARLSEIPGKAPAQPLPQARIRVAAEQAVATARRFGLAEEGKALAILCPGAEYGPAKRWPAARFAELARTLAGLGYDVALLGSANDAAVCEQVSEASGGRARCLAGKTTLDEAIELIAGAALVVTNDSGLMHVAAALDRPQVALFGSSSPLHTPPRSARARVVWLALECSPCFEPVCPLGHFRCMRDISVDRVLSESAALAMLAPAQHGETRADGTGSPGSPGSPGSTGSTGSTLPALPTLPRAL